ncbi:DNA gyrase inhibitor YacG [Alysiella crassa]|uniref:DNA gyrase inhibitor YacG n=1 Tax=Alysiella crassa TaxID=153491 RepID=A0A376BLP3_9NEIS|nr:DNA gyrase inhibitor YacG [Alysiella crassa]UOP07272.1 DNA gyrase inhibitor YacG [Alysiella crassa]SSY70555.1 DNA gyrase inhibitor YacG [Alysiella crassa]
MNQILTVKCPICAAAVAWLPENAFRPFCSERCKLTDLGEWADDSRAIPCPPDELADEFA